MTNLPVDNAAFVERLTASGGELRIEQPTGSERAAWRRALHALINSTDIPPGQRVRFSGRDRGPLCSRRVPVDEGVSVREYAAVPVRQRLSHLHPMLAATREACKHSHQGWVDTRRTKGVLHVRVASSSVRRTLLLTQALVDEASRRGWTVGPFKGYSCDGGFGVTINRHAFELAFAEEPDRMRHEPSKSELAAAERSSWVRIPDWDYTPSGRLMLRIGHDGYSNRTLATDRKRWRIEDRLAAPLICLSPQRPRRIAARLNEHGSVKHRPNSGERQWIVRAGSTRNRFGPRMHAIFAGRWRVATDLREMVRAERDASSDEVDQEWLAWVETYAADLDPTTDFRPPAPAEVPPEDLRRFLGKWSPFGPERTSW